MTIEQDRLNRTVTIDRLFELAGQLASEDQDNGEYDRALANLVGDAAGLNQEDQPEVAAEIRRRNVAFYGRGRTSGGGS
jgi:hypothetical protein